ncbi:MAG: dihydrofolate reductase family protein, partial [Acidimicrobiales bacterium]
MRVLLPGPSRDADLEHAYRIEDPGARHVRANFVSSLDGVATVSGRSRGLSSEGDRRIFGTLRAMSDVILVGAGTARVERYRTPSLPAGVQARRVEAGLAPLPRLAVLSSSLRLAGDLPLFGDPAEPPLLLVAPRAAELRDDLAGRAEAVEVGPVVAGRIPLPAVVAALQQRNLRRILCEGGPDLLSQLLAADLVDELCLTVSPQLVGPGEVRLLTT